MAGKFFDVAMDLRQSSPTFGKWQGFVLSEENKDQPLLPSGFGHGYLVLEPSIVSYKCGEKFYGEFEDGIQWDDPDIGIDWPLAEVGGRGSLILAERIKTCKALPCLSSGMVVWMNRDPEGRTGRDYFIDF